MRRYLSIALLLLLTLLPAAAQFETPPPGLDELFAGGDNYFLEVTSLPGMIPQKGRAVVSFRLSYDLLTFRTASQTFQKGNAYVATPTIYVEAVGIDGVISDRAKWQDSARARDFAETNSRSTFITGAVVLSLRPGLYTIRYTFDDGTPGSGFTEAVNGFRMDDFSGASPAIGTPLQLKDLLGDTLVAASIDGNAMFGHRMRAYVPLAASEEPTRLRYEILSAPKPGAGAPKVQATGLATILGKGTLDRPIPTGNDLRFVIRRDSAPATAYGAMIDASTSDLDPGDYLLVLTCESGYGSTVDTARFKLRWVDAPISLAKVDYAIKALYPIVSDDSLDLLQSGDRERQSAALKEFWARRDPTPGTRYNEAMAEYYRRVDYAYFNFKSISQKDGAFTDRGKIYILYGPPSEVNRELQPDADPKEIWLYKNKVGRGFVFTDQSKSGEYRLTEYYDL